MIDKLVYSKHSAEDRCGIAYFASKINRLINGKHINSFHGFSNCNEFYINMDVYELSEHEINSLISYIDSGSAKFIILLLHDYRETYLENILIRKCDLIINLSGEPKLKLIAPQSENLFTPSLIELPKLGFTKSREKPLSLAFGFFSVKKKSFSNYVTFYERMIKNYPNWNHIIIASSHTGVINNDSEILKKLLNYDNINVLDYLPNMLLSELISASDLGVCFYPTGILSNNTVPMSFFQQEKCVITNYSKASDDLLKDATMDYDNLNEYNFNDFKILKNKGIKSKETYESNYSWDIFMSKLNHLITNCKNK